MLMMQTDGVLIMQHTLSDDGISMMNKSLQKMLKSEDMSKRAKDDMEGSTGGDPVIEPPKIRFNEK